MGEHLPGMCAVSESMLVYKAKEKGTQETKQSRQGLEIQLLCLGLIPPTFHTLGAGRHRPVIHALGTGNLEDEGFKVIFDSVGVLGQPGL